MSYYAYVCKIDNLRKHPNADRLQLGECFGNTVCVDMSYAAGEVGIYFPTDGQLSVEFAEYNNLLRKKDDAGNSIGGYMDPNKRNVTSIRLRGEKSDGLFLHLDCISYTKAEVKEGDSFTMLNGHEICQKYIPRSHNQPYENKVKGNRTRKRKVPIAPLFVEHADTEQLAYNLGAFHPGDYVEITLKMHGTSQRTGRVPMFVKYKRSFIDWLLRRPGTPVYDWGYVSGTRRTVLENFDGGYYGSNAFREQHSKFFEGKLHKGEEVYYEVVGFTDTGASIMGVVSNKKLNDKAFVKQYGEMTTFSYGCSPTGYMTYEDGSHDALPQSDFYVYRMTMTNEDGDIVEYTPDYMRYRCAQMGCKCVPLLWSGIIPAHTGDEAAISLGQGAGAWIKAKAEEFYDGPDPIGKTHVREGVVCRIVNRPAFTAYKHKNFAFKCLEGICKAEETEPDMEEAEEVKDEA